MLRNWVMTRKTPKDDNRPWADIQRDYEAGTFKHIDDLCGHYGITQGALYYKVSTRTGSAAGRKARRCASATIRCRD